MLPEWRVEVVSVGSNASLKIREELMVCSERPMQHQLLPAVLLVIGAIRVRREEWSDNDHYCLAPEGWFITHILWDGVALHEVQDCHPLKVWCGWPANVVVKR